MTPASADERFDTNTIGEQLRAVLYVRRSDQSDSSIDDQIDEGTRYIENTLGAVLVKIYNDGNYASGYHHDEDTRPQYREMVREVLEDDIADVVVVRRLSRFGRDRHERMFRMLQFYKDGVEIHTPDGGAVDLDDDYALAVQSMKATADDVEKRKEIEDLKKRVEKRKENGYYQGYPPFGYRFDDAGEYLEPDPETFETALRAVRLRGEGWTYEDIADEVGLSVGALHRICTDRRERILADARACGYSISP